MDSFKKKKKYKKGQIAFISVMIAVVVIILALALVPSLFETTNSDTVLGVDGLNCSNPDISNQDKANCTSIDSTPFVYGFVLFGLSIMLLRRIML